MTVYQLGYKNLMLGLVLTTSSAAMANEPAMLRQLRTVMEAPELAAKLARRIAPQCTNFSGKWRGSCVDSRGRTDSDERIIMQENCDSIYIDGMNLNINGSITIGSEPNPDQGRTAYNATVALGWNDSQSKLYSLMTASGNRGLIAATFGHAMWMAGDQLRTGEEYVKLFSVQGPLSVNVSTKECTYNKVASLD